MEKERLNTLVNEALQWIEDKGITVGELSDFLGKLQWKIGENKLMILEEIPFTVKSRSGE